MWNNTACRSAGSPVRVFLKEVVRLHCVPPSRVAQPRWERPGGELSPNIYMQEDGGHLSFLATTTTLGTYECQAVENGFTQTLAVYEVTQKEDPTLPPSSASSTRGPETGHRPTTLTRTERTPVAEEKRPARRPTPSASAVTRSSTLTPAEGLTDMLQRETSACYLKELVAVSVLLVMCVCALLSVAAYTLRKSYRSRTAPHSSPGRRDTEGGPDQEREALRGNSPQLDKHNGQKSPNTPSNGVSNGSSGHLPNIPI